MNQQQLHSSSSGVPVVAVIADKASSQHQRTASASLSPSPTSPSARVFPMMTARSCGTCVVLGTLVMLALVLHAFTNEVTPSILPSSSRFRSHSPPPPPPPPTAAMVTAVTTPPSQGQAKEQSVRTPDEDYNGADVVNTRALFSSTYHLVSPSPSAINRQRPFDVLIVARQSSATLELFIDWLTVRCLADIVVETSSSINRSREDDANDGLYPIHRVVGVSGRQNTASGCQGGDRQQAQPFSILIRYGDMISVSSSPSERSSKQVVLFFCDHNATSDDQAVLSAMRQYPQGTFTEVVDCHRVRRASVDKNRTEAMLAAVATVLVGGRSPAGSVALASTKASSLLAPRTQTPSLDPNWIALLASVVPRDAPRFLDRNLWWVVDESTHRLESTHAPGPAIARQCAMEGTFFSHEPSKAPMDELCAQKPKDCAFSGIHTYDERQQMLIRGNRTHKRTLPFGFATRTWLDQVVERFASREDCQTIIYTLLLRLYDPVPLVWDYDATHVCLITFVDRETDLVLERLMPASYHRWEVIVLPDDPQAQMLYAYTHYKIVEVFKLVGVVLFPYAERVIFVDGKAKLKVDLHLDRVKRKPTAVTFVSLRYPVAHEFSDARQRLKLRLHDGGGDIDGGGGRAIASLANFQLAMQELDAQLAFYKHQRHDMSSIPTPNICIVSHIATDPCTIRFMAQWLADVAYFNFRGQLSAMFAAQQAHILPYVSRTHSRKFYCGRHRSLIPFAKKNNIGRFGNESGGDGGGIHAFPCFI